MSVVEASEWLCAHAAKVDVHSNSIIFTDSDDDTWHLMSVSRPEYANADITLKIIAVPCADCSTWIYVNHWGSVDIGYISADGHVVKGRCDALEARVTDRGEVEIEIAYRSTAPSIYVGTSKAPGQPKYIGSAQPQWRFKEINVASRRISASAIEKSLVVIDVGASGGIGNVWLPVLDQVHCVLFEPDPEEAANLRKQMGCPSGQVIEAALFNVSDERELKVTRFAQCSSLLEPNKEVLERYEVSPCFEVVRRVRVRCTRFDEIPNMPCPDVIKIDAQGAEFQILEGFGKHLDRVLFVEVESQFYSIYKDQRLLHDIIAMLEKHGLFLRMLTPQRNFDRDYLEVNAYFSRDETKTEEQASKLDMLHNLFGLSKFPGGQELAAAALRSAGI